MRNILLVLVSLSFGLSAVASTSPCGSKSINVAGKDYELIRVIEKPEKTAQGQEIKGANEVLVSGIYMFVRNGQTWNTYRCADDIKRENGNPVLNLKNCVLKNDFEFGNLVKRYGTSGIVVRRTDTNRLQIRLNVSGTENLDYYDVKATSAGLEIIQNKYQENKQQRYLSHHEGRSMGVCSSEILQNIQAAPAVKAGANGKLNKVNSGN